MLKTLCRLGALAVGFSLGCGPMRSTALFLDAQSSLEAAKNVQAQQWAPYEWAAANAYFEKAQEEAGSSEYEQAIRYSEKAIGFAVKAKDVAQKAQKAQRTKPVTP